MTLSSPPIAGGPLTLLVDVTPEAGAATRAAGATAVPGLAPGARLDDAAPAAAAAKPASGGARPRASRTRASPGAGYAGGAGSTAASGAKKKKAPAKAPDPLAFLTDKSLSIEEKLFRFLKLVEAHYDKRLQDKMKEIAGKQATTTAAGAAAPKKKKKKKGLFGRIAGAIKTVFPVAGIGIELLQNKTVASLLKQLSGPVLSAAAAAFGMPQLAPLLLKAGPELAGAVTSLAKELDAPAEKTEAAAKTSTSSTSTKTTPSTSTTAASTGVAGDIKQSDMMELQRLQEKQREMVTLVSNLLRSMHDTRMSVIANVRA